MRLHFSGKITKLFSNSIAPTTRPPISGEVKAVQVHYPGPCRHEVFHKLLLRVRARIDFREGSELGVRTEDQVDTGTGPLDLVRLSVASFVDVFRVGGRLPFGCQSPFSEPDGAG